MLTSLTSSDPIRFDPRSCFIFVFVTFWFLLHSSVQCSILFFIFLFLFFRIVNCKMCRGQNILNANNNNNTYSSKSHLFFFAFSSIQYFKSTYDIRDTSRYFKYMHEQNLQNSFWLSCGMRQDPSLLPFCQTGSCSCIYSNWKQWEIHWIIQLLNYSDNAIWDRFLLFRFVDPTFKKKK